MPGSSPRRLISSTACAGSWWATMIEPLKQVWGRTQVSRVQLLIPVAIAAAIS